MPGVRARGRSGAKRGSASDRRTKWTAYEFKILIAYSEGMFLISNVSSMRDFSTESAIYTMAYFQGQKRTRECTAEIVARKLNNWRSRYNEVKVAMMTSGGRNRTEE